MPRKAGDVAVTAEEAGLALLLREVGFSYRRIGELLGRSDHTIRAMQARIAKMKLTAEQKAAAKDLKRFREWLEEGARGGFLELIAKVIR